MHSLHYYGENNEIKWQKKDEDYLDHRKKSKGWTLKEDNESSLDLGPNVKLLKSEDGYYLFLTGNIKKVFLP